MGFRVFATTLSLLIVYAILVWKNAFHNIADHISFAIAATGIIINEAIDEIKEEMKKVKK